MGGQVQKRKRFLNRSKVMSSVACWLLGGLLVVVLGLALLWLLLWSPALSNGRAVSRVATAPGRATLNKGKKKRKKNAAHQLIQNKNRGEMREEGGGNGMRKSHAHRMFTCVS